MDNLRIFENSEFGRVRTVLINGKPHAVGVDVARALGYKNPNDAVTRHCRGCVKHAVIDNLGRTQETNVIPEGDIYRLTINSELPSADRFERWVFDEVLPAIRQTGAYISPAHSIEDLIIMQATAMKQLRGQVEEVAAVTETLTHRVKNLDLIDIKGTPRQRLNAMIRKYAHQNKLLFKQGWRDFVTAYNTAYNTNLNLRKTLKETTLSRELTIPEFLEKAGEIEDALRVADKMLNS